MSFLALLVTVPFATAATGREWSYNPAGLRDPFGSIYIPPGCGGGPEPVGLQRWDTSQLVLTGIVQGESGPSAMLVDPEGLAWIIRPGTYVGENWGKVTAISPAGIVVTEEFRTITGELVVNTLELRIR